LPLDLAALFRKAVANYHQLLKPKESLVEPILDFCFERLRSWYHEQEIPARAFESVLAKGPTKPSDFDFRIKAVTDFLRLPEAESLIAANKRVKNILTKSDVTIEEEAEFDSQLLQEPAEKALAAAIQQTRLEIQSLLKSLGSSGNHYTMVLKEASKLKVPVDTFFDEVMVMVEDPAIRENRLKLLGNLRAIFLSVADISVL